MANRSFSIALFLLTAACSSSPTAPTPAPAPTPSTVIVASEPLPPAPQPDPTPAPQAPPAAPSKPTPPPTPPPPAPPPPAPPRAIVAYYAHVFAAFGSLPFSASGFTVDWRDGSEVLTFGSLTVVFSGACDGRKPGDCTAIGKITPTDFATLHLTSADGKTWTWTFDSNTAHAYGDLVRR